MLLNTEYQNILKHSLAMRCERNRRYSLRAFARDLELSPSYLCEILKGKHKLTQSAAKSIASKLGLDSSTKNRFDMSVGLANATDAAEREWFAGKLKTLDQSSKLDEEKFSIIGNWRDLAALQALLLKDHIPSVEWLARRLGQSMHWAEDCIRRFKKIELINTGANKWVPTFTNLSCESALPSKVIRKFHKSLLRKAVRAVDLDNCERRSDALVLAVRKEQLPAAFERLKSFALEFDQEFGALSQADTVYALTMQFFPLIADPDTGTPGKPAAPRSIN